MVSPPDISTGDLVKRMLGLAWRYRAGCIKVLGLRFLVMAATIAGLAMVGLGIDVVAYWADSDNYAPPAYPFGMTPPDTWPGMVQVTAIAVMLVIFALMRAGFEFLAIDATGKLLHRDIVVSLRSMVYDKLQRLSFRFFDSNDSGSIINRVTQDVNLVGQFINGVVINVANLVIAMAISLVYMISLSPLLTLICMLPTPLMAWLAFRFARVVKPAYREARRLTDRLILILAEHLRGIHVVKGFARNRQEVEKFGAANDRVRDQRHWIFWKVSVFQPTIQTLSQINIIILLSFGGMMVVRGSLPLGTGLIVFAGLLQQFTAHVTALANVTNTIQVSLTSAQRVFEIVDTPLDIESKPDAVHLTKAQGRVEFDHVTFAYAPGEPVLENIAFTAEPGSCVAIVGATGSGKSTLMSLIPRFYDAQQGSVRVDGYDVRDLDVDDLRRQIGLVFQENFLFSNTIAANIAFGHPEATQEQIEKAARIASAHDFIMELPEGYESIIGERGADLSGGQRQRLAIARALLLEPSILILDDATAAIDPQTEHEILAAMEAAMEGRTTFVVAHRLSTLRRADLVIVLEKGRIVQTGTHAELMRTGGHYRQAARLQTADAESKRLLGMDDRDTD